MGVKLISAVKTVICCGLAASLFFSLSLNSASAASNAQNNNSAALERANQAYLARKYNDASGLVSRIILKDGESAAALNLMGKIYHRQNKIDEYTSDNYRQPLPYRTRAVFPQFGRLSHLGFIHRLVDHA